jgi:hypothetical protein
MNKIFCIGLPKTGTTSVGMAFDLLGLKHNKSTDSAKSIKSIIDGTYDYIIDEINNNDAFEDTPYHLIYKWLDVNYPESKFILTVRNSEAKFLNSLMNESESKKESGIHQLKKAATFGVPKVLGNENLVINTYNDYINNVMDYFGDRVLVLCLENGDGWGKLLDFIGMEANDIKFPHENKTVGKV